MSEVWNQLLEKQCYKNKATEGINLLTVQAINQCGGGPGPWRGPVPAELRTAQLMGFLLGRSCPLQNNRRFPSPQLPPPFSVLETFDRTWWCVGFFHFWRLSVLRGTSAMWPWLSGTIFLLVHILVFFRDYWLEDVALALSVSVHCTRAAGSSAFNRWIADTLKVPLTCPLTPSPWEVPPPSSEVGLGTKFILGDSLPLAVRGKLLIDAWLLSLSLMGIWDWESDTSWFPLVLKGACKTGAVNHHCHLLSHAWRTEEGGLPREENGADVQRAAQMRGHRIKERGKCLSWVPFILQVLVPAPHETWILLLPLVLRDIHESLNSSSLLQLVWMGFYFLKPEGLY